MNSISLWTLINMLRPVGRQFVFYCSVTHVMYHVLQSKTVNKWQRGRHMFVSIHLSAVFQRCKVKLDYLGR